MAIARNATNTIGSKTSAAATSLSATWGAATTAGSTLLLAVAWNPNSTNGTSVTLPGSWSAATLLQSATRTVGGLDTMKVAVYAIQNASSQSGTITVNFSGSFWATLHLVEITGAAAASFDVSASDNFSSLACDTGTTVTTATAAEYLFGFMANANSASTQSTPTNSFAIINQQTSTGTGTDHLSSAIYDRTVAATGTYGTGATISGATSRSWAGVVVTLKQSSGGGATIPASFGTGTGGSSFRSWVGLSARTTSADVSAAAATYGSTFKLRSCYKLWSAFEPSAPSDINTQAFYNWTGLAASIQAAADSQLTGNPWRLILRIEMGYAAPQWLFTTGVQPVTEWFFVDAAHNTSAGASADNNHCPRVFDGSETVDANLVAHTTRMLKAINTYLSQGDGHGHVLGDWVYFVAIAMPTVQPGTEMTTEPGPSTALPGGFTYDGPSSFRTGASTYRALNTNVWNSIGSAANRQTWFRNAWRSAIDLHMQYLTVCPSSVALGSLFGDGWAGAKDIATNKGAQYGDSLVFMTTSLQTDTVPYPTGTYAGWSADADTAMRNAIAAGSPVGFQTAGANILSSEAKQKAAFDTGLGDYNMAFFETSPGQAANYFPASTTGTGWPGEAAAQLLLVSDTGGTPGRITGQANMTLERPSSRRRTSTVRQLHRHQDEHVGLRRRSRRRIHAHRHRCGLRRRQRRRHHHRQRCEPDEGGEPRQHRDGRHRPAAPILARHRASRRPHDRPHLRPQGGCEQPVHARRVHHEQQRVPGPCEEDHRRRHDRDRIDCDRRRPSFSTGVNYWVRTAATGSSPTTLQVKVWADGTAEPDWQFTATDGDAVLQSTGSVSIIARAESAATSVPNTFTFDAYQVFPQSPQLLAAGQAGAVVGGSGGNVATGTGHKHTPRS